MDHSISDIKSNLKGRFPFRLGTTSYIIPDDLAPNAKYLGPLVDDIELVLFESDEISNLPDKAVLAELKAIKKQHQLSYTVHLPLDTQLGSRDEEERQRSVGKCKRVIDLCDGLEPFAYIVHFHGDRRGNTPTEDIGSWQKALTTSAEELAGHVRSPDLLCVETLDYPFSLVADIVTHYNMSVCLDVGHLAVYGYDIPAHLEQYWEKCRVLHLHGNENEVDHKDIGFFDPIMLEVLIHRLIEDPHSRRVLTLEIFGQNKLAASLSVLEKFVK